MSTRLGLDVALLFAGGTRLAGALDRRRRERDRLRIDPVAVFHDRLVTKVDRVLDQHRREDAASQH